MSISGLSEYGGLYNNYRVVDIPRVDFDEVKAQDEIKKAEEVSSVLSLPESNETVPDLRSKSADLDNISLTFNKQDDYSYLGMDFNIESLDMDQAISDMRRDSILEDYQYFVGSADRINDAFQSEDGKVVIKL